jgi:hypothetical protein
MGRACSRYGEMRDMYKSLVLNSEGKRLIGRSGRRLKMILEPTFKKWGCRWGLSRSRQGPLTSPCETCDKLTSCNMKDEFFLNGWLIAPSQERMMLWSSGLRYDVVSQGCY